MHASQIDEPEKLASLPALAAALPTLMAETTAIINDLDRLASRLRTHMSKVAILLDNLERHTHG